MNTLKDHELRELQLFLSQSPLLYSYFNLFATNKITKELLLESDESFLNLIYKEFNMKLGEYGALRLLVKNQSSKASSNSKSKRKPTMDANSESFQVSTSSQNHSESSSFEPALLPPVNKINKPLLETSESMQNQINEESQLILKGDDNSSIIQNIEEVEEYKDNTITEFKIGNLKYFSFIDHLQ